MKALVLESNGHLVYREVPNTIALGNNVLIKVEYCGICGSDIPRVFDNAARSYPMILGHEFSGSIADVGEDVHGLKKGDRVIAAPLIPCMQCDDCKKGNYSLCSSYSFVGSRRMGAMADYVVVPAQNVLKFSEAISYQQAATIEPATVGLHAMYHCKFEQGSNVAVIGCGIIGLDTMQWLKIKGAKKVVAVGRGEYGLNVAEKIGAETVSTKNTSAEDILKLYPQGFDFVFECSGAEQTMHLAIELVGKKGTVCFVGTPKKDVSFTIKEWEQINRKECFVTGSWMSYSAPFPGKEWSETIVAMEMGRFRNIPERVYAVFPMHEGAKAFQMIREGKSKGRVLLKNDDCVGIVDYE